MKELRKKLKENGNFIEEEEEKIIDTIIEDSIRLINDFYPVENPRESKAYSFLTKEKRSVLDLKTSVIKFLAKELSSFITEILKLKPVYSNSQILELHWNDIGSELNISLSGTEGSLALSLNSQENFLFKASKQDSQRWKKGTLYDVLWKFNLKQFERALGRESNTNDIFDEKFFLWEGRIFRAFYILKKYFLLLSILIESNNNESNNDVTLVLDEFIQLKARSIYHRTTEHDLSVFDRIKNFKLEFSEGNEFIPFYSLGIFDFSFFWREVLNYDSAKLDEDFFYSILQQNLCYADRHSILRISRTLQRTIWRGIILAKLKENAMETISQIWKKNENNEDKHRLKNLMKEYFFGFSSGWEDIVFVVEGNLENIFSVKERLSKEEWIKRTETIICLNLQEVSSETSEETGNFAIHATARIESFEPPEENSSIRLYMYPGRHDVLYFKDNLSQNCIASKLVKFLNSIEGNSIKDVHIDILKKL